MASVPATPEEIVAQEFVPDKSRSRPVPPKARRRQTSHRELTSDEIINMKREELETKKRKEEEKNERKKKRKDKNNLCAVCYQKTVYGNSEVTEWVQCDACSTWLHEDCIPTKYQRESYEEDPFYCPRCVATRTSNAMAALVRNIEQ